MFRGYKSFDKSKPYPDQKGNFRFSPYLKNGKLKYDDPDYRRTKVKLTLPFSIVD